jgi:hypothetical protein
MESLILDLVQKLPYGAAVLMVLGSLVVIGQAVVVITPSKKDDAIVDELKKGIFGKLIDLIAAFAPFQKK